MNHPFKKNAKLVLSNGITFTGFSFGAKGSTVGEIVFNTGMTGYCLLYTSPSPRDGLLSRMPSSA